MAAKHPITPAGYQRLADEQQRLWHSDRPKIVNEVADAAAHGDRSENAEYIYGKKKLREIDKRMRYLSQRLDKLTIVEPSKVRSDRIEFGATVDMEDADGKRKTYQLVGVDEVDVKAGRVSIASPIGKALLDKKVGDIATVHRPAGELEVEILAIRYV